MIGNSFALLTGLKRHLFVLTASGAVFTAGCANMATTATNVNSLSSAASLKGTIHGGNQPVVGATVSLWYAGQKPTPASIAATTTTDSSGSFSFVKDTVIGNAADNGTTDTFSCPSGSDPLVYVISKGGNTQNNGNAAQANSAAAFISVYGACSTLSGSSQVNMTEATTVATMAALEQFFDPTNDNVIADGTGQEYNVITKIPATIALLADAGAGTAVTSTTLSAAAAVAGNIAPTVSVTATPEPGKVNMLANVLSACINTASSSSPSCSSLFTAAVPPVTFYTSNYKYGTLPTAIDTLQTIYYLLSNPTSGGSSNMSTIFGLAGGVSGPYQPALAIQPTDWTIAIKFASTSTCGTATGGTGDFINSPIDINIDNADNVWIANSQAGIGNLSEISSGGVPTTCILLGSGGSKGGAIIDSAGNVWIGSGTSLYRYAPFLQSTLAFPTTVPPLGVTADGLGNVYFTSVSGSTGSLYQVAGAATAASAVTPVQISNGVGTNPVRLMPDYQSIRTNGVTSTVQGNIFVSSGSTFISEVSPSAATGNLNGFSTSTINTSGNSYGISLGPANQLFVAAFDSGVISALGLSAGAYTPLYSFPYTTPAMAGVAAPTSIAVDGRLNIWTPDNVIGTGTDSKPAGGVSEVGSQGIAAALSPSTGFQKSSSFLNYGRVLAVDQAGNVWVAGDGADFLTEIVGAAVPIFQPYSVGLFKGRFQTIP